MTDITPLIALINQTGGIPLKIVTTTNWSQLILSLIIGSIAMFWFFGNMLNLEFNNLSAKIRLYMIKMITKRHIILIKHTKQALFSQSMITIDTQQEILKALQKFKGKPFDLILHTPGGEIFSTLAISRIFKNYPSRIRAIIPFYSMSGGTLLALSSNEIFMGNSACLGSVDPQLGSIFRYGSSASWNKILKFKGKKSEDQSISFAYTGKQYTKSIKEYLDKIVGFNLDESQKEKFINFITSGEVEHAFPLTSSELKQFGFRIGMIPNKIMNHLIKIISSKGGEGVVYI
jgi:ClpP class serine protease